MQILKNLLTLIGMFSILIIPFNLVAQSDLSKQQLENILKAIVKTKNTTIAISPNSDAGNYIMFKILKEYSKKYNFIKNFPSLPRNDYLGMLTNCKILIGNSSSGIVEAGYFDITVINVGIRQKNRESRKNIMDAETPDNPTDFIVTFFIVNLPMITITIKLI